MLQIYDKIVKGGEVLEQIPKIKYYCLFRVEKKTIREYIQLRVLGDLYQNDKSTVIQT